MMKTMKTHIYLLGIIVITCVLSCSDYDDSSIKSDISSFDARISTLESYCSTLNGQVSSIQTTVSAIEESVYVTDLSAIYDGETITGYMITFSNGTSFTLYNGSNGADGSETNTPIIGVVLVDGVYYWTLDGEIIYVDGEPLRASANAGESGGTPQLKIEDGYWWVSYDGGTNWTQLGEVTEIVVQYITGVNYDSDSVNITLYDGTVLTLSIKEDLSITFDLPTVELFQEGASVDVAYTITGADETTTLKTITRDGYTVVVTSNDIDSGVINITAPSDLVDSHITVFVNNSETTLMRVITIMTDGFITVTNDAVTVGTSAGEVLVPVSTNMDYTVTIPEDADWLSYTGTRTVRTDSLVFYVTENDAIDDRYTTVTLTSTGGAVTETILITQEGYGMTLNENWSISYYGKYKEGSTYYDRVDYICNDEVQYITLVGEWVYYEDYSVEDLFEEVQDILSSGSEDDYYVMNYEASSTSVNYLYDPFNSSSEYIAYMFAVDDDGLLTGLYQKSETFYTEQFQATSAYKAWYGTWTYTDALGNTGTISIKMNNSNINYYLCLDGGVYSHKSLFNEDDGTLIIRGGLTQYGSWISSTKTFYTYGIYAASYLGGDALTVVGEENYDIATCTLSDDGTTATVTTAEITTSDGQTGTAYSMSYYGRTLTEPHEYLTLSDYSDIVFPVSLTYSSSATSIKE